MMYRSKLNSKTRVAISYAILKELINVYGGLIEFNFNPRNGLIKWRGKSKANRYVSGSFVPFNYKKSRRLIIYIIDNQLSKQENFIKNIDYSMFSYRKWQRLAGRWFQVS